MRNGSCQMSAEAQYASVACKSKQLPNVASAAGFSWWSRKWRRLPLHGGAGDLRCMTLTIF